MLIFQLLFHWRSHHVKPLVGNIQQQKKTNYFRKCRTGILCSVQSKIFIQTDHVSEQLCKTWQIFLFLSAIRTRKILFFQRRMAGFGTRRRMTLRKMMMTSAVSTVSCSHNSHSSPAQDSATSLCSAGSYLCWCGKLYTVSHKKWSQLSFVCNLVKY